MEKSNMIGLSTACITASTADIINESSFTNESICDDLIAYQKGTYGWLIHVPENIEVLKIPKDLKACLNYAKSNGCEWIMFDRDIEYDEADGLEKYSW